ncbi:Sodium channel protein para [Nymphon striatum]|nr:Sodium channel protein para [Nymphon striatum]
MVLHPLSYHFTWSADTLKGPHFRMCNDARDIMQKLKPTMCEIDYNVFKVIQYSCIEKTKSLIGDYEPLLEMARRRKLQWFGHVTRQPGSMDHTVMHGMVEGTSRFFIPCEVNNGNKVSTIGQKGANGINVASTQRGDRIVVEAGVKVHTDCRKRYTNPQQIERKLSANLPISPAKKYTRDAKGLFNNKTDCFFCGVTIQPESSDYSNVKTDTFADSILKCCDNRSDDWATTVKGRIEYFCGDLHAADCIYHHPCSIHFWTDRDVPQQYRSCHPRKRRKSGRPRNQDQEQAFLEMCFYLEANDEEQLTISDLGNKMKEFLADKESTPYGNQYLKQKLMEHYGDSIYIAEGEGVHDIVTMREKTSQILRSYFKSHGKEEDEEAQKRAIIKTAARLIRSYIKTNVPSTSDKYPSIEMLKLESAQFTVILMSGQLRKLDDNVITAKEPQSYMTKDIGSAGSLSDGEEKKDLSNNEKKEMAGSKDDLADDQEEAAADRIETTTEDAIVSQYPADCYPDGCYSAFPWCLGDETNKHWRNWNQLRAKTYWLIENKYFETIVVVMILLSSLALAAEDVHLKNKPLLKEILYYMDRFFTIAFFLEMLIKMLALGFKTYFTNAWCWLDFVIVLVVVNALVQAIPAIANVLLVCLIFWLIFSIIGVQFFGGKFQQCIDGEGVKVNHTYVPNKEVCVKYNLTWHNPKINFDNVINAYLALFQVATFKGWMEIMKNAIDSRTDAGGSLEMFMTDDQKKYYSAMKKMGSKKPVKAIPRPKFKLQSLLFDLTTNTKFDMFIMLFIGLNMVMMAMDHYRPSQEFIFVINKLNVFFVAIFTAECVLKMFALRFYYFKEPWNVFDFVIVVLSILGLAMKEIIEEYFVSPTMLRVVRVVKVGRVLRLVKGARGIRTLLFALAMSLPALFNICLLLFLIMFIFAIFGMSFFMNVKHRYGIDGVFNFETFGQSMILLFQMSTSAGWHTVLDAIIDETDCDKGENGNCGSYAMGIIFLVSYLFISFLVIINMYIAVILENYSQATEDVQEGLTDDDYDMYYEVWQIFDPKGTQYIPLTKLSNFLHRLEEPLQIEKPNRYKIATMDIPICKNDMMYCVDILDALTRDFFARKGNQVEDTNDMGGVAPRCDVEGYEPISSTLWREREEHCTKIIQHFWRRYRGSGLVDTTHPQQTAIVIESDGHVTKNGHKVVIHSRSPSVTSRSTDV